MIATLCLRSAISKAYFAFIDDDGHQRLAVTRNYGGAVMSVGNILPAEEAAKMQVANVHDADKKIVGVVGVPLDEFEERMKLLEEDALSVWDAMVGAAEIFRRVVPAIADANKVGLHARRARTHANARARARKCLRAGRAADGRPEGAGDARGGGDPQPGNVCAQDICTKGWCGFRRSPYTKCIMCMICL